VSVCPGQSGSRPPFQSNSTVTLCDRPPRSAPEPATREQSQLVDLKNEGRAFDLAKAERLWWQQYVPLLHVVCVNGLPMTVDADKLAQEDLSDAGILQPTGLAWGNGCEPAVVTRPGS
jgi:hypothetical protein